jgi:transcriptional regulator with XRE-family HTH domain
MGDLIHFPQPEPLTERGIVRDPQPAPLWREAIGRELREERLGQERTLADVAGDAGVSTQYLSEVERGRKEPSSEVIEAVGGALGLTLVDLTARVTRRLVSTRRTPRGPLALAA